MKSNKYKMYTIGLGALFLVGGVSTLAATSSISPANKAVEKADGDKQKTAIDRSPGVNSGSDGAVKQEYRDAYRTLSPKNKAAFQTLSTKDKEKVVEAYRDGGSAQDKLTDVLNEDDQDQNATKKWKAPDTTNENSPASKAIEKHKDQNVYD